MSRASRFATGCSESGSFLSLMLCEKDGAHATAAQLAAHGVPVGDCAPQRLLEVHQ